MIREGQLSDRQAIYDLHSARVNLGEYDEMEIYFARFFNADNIIVNEVNGHVSASCQVNYHTVMINDYRIGAGVITACVPDRNNHEYMTQLLKDVDDELNHKVLLSLAISDTPSDFIKLGFESVYGRRRYQLTRDMLPNRSFDGIDRSFTVKEITDTYKAFTRNFNGYYLRDYEYWVARFETFKYLKYSTVVFRNGKNEVEGYMVFGINQTNVFVYEIVYLTGEALVRLLCYAFKYKDKATVMVSEHENLNVLIPGASYRNEPGVLAKINNLTLFNSLFGCSATTTEEALNSSGVPLFLNEEF